MRSGRHGDPKLLIQLLCNVKGSVDLDKFTVERNDFCKDCVKIINPVQDEYRNEEVKVKELVLIIGVMMVEVQVSLDPLWTRNSQL